MMWCVRFGLWWAMGLYAAEFGWWFGFLNSKHPLLIYPWWIDVMGGAAVAIVASYRYDVVYAGD